MELFQDEPHGGLDFSGVYLDDEHDKHLINDSISLHILWPY